jgi:hypothetical protein
MLVPQVEIVTAQVVLAQVEAIPAQVEVITAAHMVLIQGKAALIVSVPETEAQVGAVVPAQVGVVVPAQVGVVAAQVVLAHGISAHMLLVMGRQHRPLLGLERGIRSSPPQLTACT